VVVDGGVGLGDAEAVGEGVVGEVLEPVEAAQDAGLHSVAEVGEDTGFDAGVAELGGPVDHGLVGLGPEGVVGGEEIFELCGIEGLMEVVGDGVPVGVAVEDAVIVGVAVVPIGGVEGVFVGGEDLFHALPGCGVGWAAEDLAVVEEDGVDGLRRGFVRSGHAALIVLRAVCWRRMRFSERTGWDLEENDFSVAVREARAAGKELFDLTVSNPTACGFAYDAEALLGPLGDAAALVYEPEAMGMVRARKAVAGYYRDAGANVAAERVCLTTSTSEAYSFLFRLLCDPGDEVLIARPSYPLFEFIARLDDVSLVEYPLVYDGRWSIDLHALESAVTERTRAVVVVHPNNPTGNFASEIERVALQELCARRGLALIVDEVFLDYAVEGVEARSFPAEEGPSRDEQKAVGLRPIPHPASHEAASRGWGTRFQALTFVLSGLSKVCGLPQMKVSWIVVAGPEEMVSKAMGRLEVIADTFLSMNAPMQFALPHWLGMRRGLQEQIRERMRVNLAVLDARLMGTQASRLAMEGGWTAVLRVPRHVAGKAFAEAALERSVVVQPGEFYGLSEGYVVVSLLTLPAVWTRGLGLLPVG